MKIVYQGKLIELDPKKAIGDGGEANVIRHNNLAFKIYHDPTIQRARKLSDFLNAKFSFPENVMSPIDVLASILQIYEYFKNDRDALSKIYILEDCMSSVAHPVIDFEKIAQDTFDKFRNSGINIVKKH